MTKPGLLLHTCCAPCSGFLAQKFILQYDVSIFYDNSNIYPEEEYNHRQAEAKNFFKSQSINFICPKRDHQKWLEGMLGLEKEPERGKRCKLCYYGRLKNTAEYASANGFEFFATTLSISPHKDVIAINNLGRALAKKYKIKFLAGDWKKQDGFKSAMEFSHQHDFYHQNYCGCEFSVRLPKA
ncbi:MAG: epoxyqueuosine reductase QueH [bacterium]